MSKYKDLMKDPYFLKVRLRARQLTKNGTDLLAIKYAERKLLFKTASGTYGKRVIWTQEVEITDATLDNILNARTFRDVEDLIRNSDIKCNCNCPADLYWGFKYIRWKKGSGLVRETRRPVVRNPFEINYLCKHLWLVLSLYPFWAKSLASKFKNWAVTKEEKEGINQMQRVRMNRINRDFARNYNPPKDINEENTEEQELENELE